MDELTGVTTSPCYLSFWAEAVPIVRGYLAAALEAPPPTSDAALEVCAAWTELEEVAHLPTIHDIETPASAVEALTTARSLLHDAMLTAHSVTTAMGYGRAVRHLDDALRLNPLPVGTGGM